LIDLCVVVVASNNETQKRRKIDMVNRIANFDDRQAAGEGQTAKTETATTTADDDNAKRSGEQEALVDQQSSVITDVAIDDDVILTSTAREPDSAPDEHDIDEVAEGGARPRPAGGVGP
jgi:hypothetical protein